MAPWQGGLSETSPCSGVTRHPLFPPKKTCSAAEAHTFSARVSEKLQTRFQMAGYIFPLPFQVWWQLERVDAGN